jgi:hypothetical protein
MIYRGPGFLAVVCIGYSPTPLALTPVLKLSLFLSLPVCRRPSLLTGEGEGAGEEPNRPIESPADKERDREKERKKRSKLQKSKQLKGTVSRDLLLVFLMKQFPPAPEYSIRTVPNFFPKIRGDIRKSRCTTGINDTGGKFFQQFR